MPPNIKVPGLKGGIPSGYVIGRVDPGTGEAQLISIAELTRQIKAGLTVGDIPPLGDSGVTPGTYGDATNVGQFTVNAQGLITFADDVPISGGGGGGGGSLELIGEVVTTGSAADVTFSSIPSTFRDLEIRVSGRGNAAGVTNIGLQVQLNGDTGANYDYAFAESNGAGGTAFSGAAAQTSLFIGRLTAATAPADVAALVTAELGNYPGTTFEKAIVSRSGHKLINSATGANQLAAGGSWRSTAAVTDIKVFPASSTFVDGTVVSLYGRGGASTGGGDVALADEVVTAGTQSSVTLTPLGTGNHLKIILSPVGTQAAQTVAFNMRLNGDTGSNYAYSMEHRLGTASSASATSMQCGFMAGASHTSTNYRFPTEIIIPNYRDGAGYANIRAGTGYLDNTPAFVDIRHNGWWKNTAAITSIEIFAGLGAFANGHRFSLYEWS